MAHTCHAIACDVPVPPARQNTHCPKCGANDFVALKGKTPKRRCRPCRNAYARKHQREHQEYAAARLVRDPLYFVRRNVRLRYGLSWGDYQNLLAAQDGKCKICGLAPIKRRLVVDHCHVTGRVRGLLCHLCNCALSYLENEDWKAKANAYLSRHWV